jgi:tetratricopeptide (TPR) repeat protein
LPNLTPTGTDGGSGGTDPTNGSGYDSYYITVNRANQVIKGAEALDADTRRDIVLAEAHFLRGLSYFSLVRTFGGVPVVLDPSFASQTGIKRTTKEKVYEQIETDLNESERLFGPSAALSQRNRAGIWSVYALKARLYLYTGQWEEAEKYASKLIESPDFRLTTEFSSFFTSSLTSEAIFEITFNSSDKNGFSNYYLTSSNGGRFYYVPEPSFVDELRDPAKGGKRGSLVYDREPGLQFNAIAEYGKRDFTSSLQILRLAEQYLIRAEARLKKASPDRNGAVADMNEIKSRADIITLDVPTSLSTADLLLEVEKERRYELAFEGHRWSDIIRTGRAVEVFGPINSRYNDPRYWVFPFPNNAIINDPDLEQDEVYR